MVGLKQLLHDNYRESSNFTAKTTSKTDAPGRTASGGFGLCFTSPLSLFLSFSYCSEVEGIFQIGAYLAVVVLFLLSIIITFILCMYNNYPIFEFLVLHCFALLRHVCVFVFQFFVALKQGYPDTSSPKLTSLN